MAFSIIHSQMNDIFYNPFTNEWHFLRDALLGDTILAKCGKHCLNDVIVFKSDKLESFV